MASVQEKTVLLDCSVFLHSDSVGRNIYVFVALACFVFTSLSEPIIYLISFLSFFRKSMNSVFHVKAINDESLCLVCDGHRV